MVHNQSHPSRAGRITAVSRITVMTLMKIFAACLIALPVLITVSIIYRHQPSDRLASFADARILERTAPQNVTPPGAGTIDKFLGGLLNVGFDERSCLSRYQSFLYRKKNSPRKPSSYLLSRLRSYEDLHKRCGPHTKPYNEILKIFMKSGHSISPTTESECRYVVWISYSGLGNRILTLASAFLYALLTNRVLLVDRGSDIPDLFCEPFPETSWLLPLDFPIANQFKDKNNGFDQKSPHSYGNMLKNNALKTESLPSYLYLHLAHDYDDHDKLFFCDQDQTLLEKVPWLIMKTDNYFVPSLFLMPSFEQELIKLFPEKEAIFHHLGTYLFHPSNQVWGLITRYYKAYLANADERIGIQVRVFDKGPGPFRYVMDQIRACTVNEKLLPEISTQQSEKNPKTTKAVLMTSLVSGYFENMRNMYWENPTVTGEVIGVYQPSHEEFQQSEKKLHNRKAWSEMYLLSLTDVLVTSGWSTFGYVAQGLGGKKPWILYKSENGTTPNPPCRRAMSMEPCFHAPPFYDCKAKKGIDTGKVVPHILHCEDVSWGLKLVDSHVEEL